MGGVRLQTLAKGLEEAQKQVGHKLDVVSLQEIPRAEPGWSQFQDGGWTVYSHREECTWRSSGICYRTADWAVIRKKSDERGIWLRLRRVSDGCHIWAGTAHLTQGSSKELHATEIHSFMMKLPPTTLPAVVGMDVNTPIGWTSDGYDWEAVGKENKGDNMLAVIRERGFCLSAPPEHQKSCPTCRPRKQDVQGRHIDVVGAKHCQHHGVGIVTDSHRFVGSDHDIVLQQVSFHSRERSRSTVKLRAEHDCQMTGKGRWQSGIRPGGRGRKSGSGRLMKGTGRPSENVPSEGLQGGKHILPTVWQRVVRIHAVVHDHFQQLYQGKPIPAFPFKEVAKAEDFSLEDLREAIGKGKGGKANGEDLVPHELLRAICNEEDGEAKMLQWYNRLLHGEERMPVCWNHAVMIVLPKCQKPQGPKQLRPICLASAACKVFARMLLKRSRPALQYSGPFQNMALGRQTVDYVWIVSRLMALDQEWKGGLWYLKLDIAKAFDSLDRGKFLTRLAEKMG